MITCSPSDVESGSWQNQLATAVSDPLELLALLELSPAHVPRLRAVADGFPLRVPRYFVGLMQRGDPGDPLLAQVLPLAEEDHPVPGYVADPVGDRDAVCEPGLLQKYHGRALMVATGACAIHCRYCFRRHFPYADHAQRSHWQATLRQLHKRPDVTELILSGGDPLSLSDDRLAALVDEAERLPQLCRLRIHTRLPVVLPARVTDRLARILAETRLQTIVVIHANHPNEITDTLRQALARLSAAGCVLLNQSVLLKSVNDDADTLAKLSESLIGVGVLPYYLHLLDPVAGAAHFDVPSELAVSLRDRLRARLPGYLVPRLVRETAGETSKTPLPP